MNQENEVTRHRSLEEIMHPYKVLFSMMETQYYDLWISEPRNARRVKRIMKTEGIRRVARGRVDKYGKGLNKIK